MKLVYVAGKYVGKTAWEVENNIRRAEEVGLEVARLGAMPVIPHTNNRFFLGELTEEFWLLAVMAVLDRCDALITVPGWQLSRGATTEVERAGDNSIPVFYTLDGLRTWLSSGANIQGSYRCVFCGKSAEKDRWGPGRIKCPGCGVVQPSPGELEAVKAACQGCGNYWRDCACESGMLIRLSDL